MENDVKDAKLNKLRALCKKLMRKIKHLPVKYRIIKDVDAMDETELNAYIDELQAILNKHNSPEL